MAPYANSEIAGLKASDNARQTTAVQHAQKITNNIYILKEIGKREPDFPSRPNQREYFEAFAAYLESIPLHLRGDSVSPANGVDTRDDHPTNHHGSHSPAGLSHKEHPTGTSWFDDDLPLCAKQYRFDLQGVIEVLEHYELKKIKTWRNTSECNVLIVYRPTRDEPEPDWRTDLTLEIMGGVHRVNEATQQHRPVMVHLCKQNAKKKNWGGGEPILQDFISQLLQSQHTEDSQALEGYGQFNGKSHEEMWSRLEKCIIHNEAKTFFILIDNITWMFDEMGEPGFKGFFKRFGRVCQELKQFKKTIKVMVTCSKKSSDVEEYFNGKEVSKISLEHHPQSLRLPEGAT